MEGDTRTTISLGPDHYGVKYLDINPLDPTALTLKSGDDRIRRMDAREKYAQGDMTVDIDGSVIKAVKVGVKLRDNTLRNTRIQGTAGPGSNGWQSFSLADLSTGPSPLLSQAAGTPDALRQYAWYDDGLVASKGIPMFDQAMTYKEVLNENYKIHERISAVYAKADFSVAGFRGDFGLRVVRTQQTSDGYLGNASGGFSPTSVDHNYTDALPSLNVVYDLSKEVILRGAVSRAMARQTFDLLSPGLRRDGTVLSKGYAGNPLLKPVHANQAEIGAEWYYADAALVSGTVFIKKLDTFTYKASKSEQVGGETLTVERPTTPTTAPTSRASSCSGSSPSATPASAPSSTTPSPTPRPAPWRASPRLKVLGNSRDQFNFSGYYERGPITLRVSYNYRSKSYGNVEMGGQVVNSAYGQWDASASWDVTRNIALYASAVNLNNEVIKSNTVDGIPVGMYENGARYSVGVRAKF